MEQEIILSEIHMSGAEDTAQATQSLWNRHKDLHSDPHVGQE